MYYDQFHTSVKNDNGGFLLLAVLTGFFAIATIAGCIENNYEDSSTRTCFVPDNPHIDPMKGIY